MACWEDGCLVLGPAGWEEGPATIHSRTFHTTMVAGTSLHLLGGNQSPGTSEVVDLATGEAREGFLLSPGRGGHCSIAVAADTVVLTGGWQAEALVTELSNLSSMEVVVRQLPSLLVNRYDHGCANYWVGDTQVSSRRPNTSIMVSSSFPLMVSYMVLIHRKSLCLV